MSKIWLGIQQHDRESQSQFSSISSFDSRHDTIVTIRRARREAFVTVFVGRAAGARWPMGAFLCIFPCSLSIVFPARNSCFTTRRHFPSRQHAINFHSSRQGAKPSFCSERGWLFIYPSDQQRSFPPASSSHFVFFSQRVPESR